MARSRLYLTSDDVSASPLENFWSGFRVQVRVDGSLYSHFSAASPTMSVCFAGTVRSVW